MKSSRIWGIVSIFVLCVGSLGMLHSREWHSITHIGTVQTSDNLSQGEFAVEFNVYNLGGLNTRFIVGAFDFLSLGATMSFDQLISSQPVHYNIPGVYAKLNILPKTSAFNLALGLDYFGFGESGSVIVSNGVMNAIYGVFFNLSQSYYTFGSRDVFTFGFRIPLLPDSYREILNTSMYFGATLGTPLFYAGISVENIFIDFTRFELITPTLTLNFSPTPEFEVSLGLQYQFNNKALNRFLSLTYRSSF